MNILQINTYDQGGGAERIALTLHKIYRQAGHDACMLVKRKLADEDQVLQFLASRFGNIHSRSWNLIADCISPFVGKKRGFGTLQEKIDIIARPKAAYDRYRGKEDFDYPASRHILEHIPFYPDLIHCHNLHCGYFDLSVLSELSKTIPVIITLHDEWMLTGHCAYTLGCDRWQIGCGDCPHLDTPPAIARDASAFNLERKRKIFSSSRFYVVTPSEWLMQRAKQSVLSGAILDTRVIHNGVDLTMFKPADKQEIRSKLGIPNDVRIIVFAANGVRNNPFKDFKTLRKAVAILTKRNLKQKLLFFAVGENAPPEQIDHAVINFVPYVKDVSEMAQYYQAADVYVHAAISDNYPTTVLEALACGTPVVATATGGIPEEIEDGVTGYLVPSRDPERMVDRILDLLTDDIKLEQMKSAAAKCASLHFDENRMADEYLDLYSHIFRDWQSKELGNNQGPV